MKRRYEKPQWEVYELSMSRVIANSIPNGGEVPIGGTGTADASRYRSELWSEYERQ